MRQGVHSDRIIAGHTEPPDRVLDQVLGDFGIVLVQIRKHISEPSIEVQLLGLSGSSWIHGRPFLPIVLRMLSRRAVPPSWSRWI